MTKQEILNREAFVKRCADESKICWFESEKLARLILRHGATYQRIQELYCNEPMNERQQARVEKKETAIERRIKGLCEMMGFGVPKFSGDPRGHTIKLTLPSGYTDDWGREGFCVPSS